jgi:hypothetical protein
MASSPALRLSLESEALAVDADDNRVVEDSIEHGHRQPGVASEMCYPNCRTPRLEVNGARAMSAMRPPSLDAEQSLD